MSKHSHLNLMDVKNSLEGRVEGLEGRFGRGPMGARDIGVSHSRYAPDFRAQAGHHHREQEEAYLVISGSGEVLLDGEVTELRQWDLVRVAPEVVRAFAAGSEGIEISPSAAEAGGRRRRAGRVASWPD